MTSLEGKAHFLDKLHVFVPFYALVSTFLVKGFSCRLLVCLPSCFLQETFSLAQGKICF